ncbi:transcriptional regulator [Candidatus Bipolaricaulota bacterium]
MASLHRYQPRVNSPNESQIRCGTLQVDCESREVILNGVSLDLTRKQYALSCDPARHPGVVFSDDDLLRELWPDSPCAASGDIRQCIHMLLRQLRRTPSNPKLLIVNVRGFRYRLHPDATEGKVKCE